MSSTPAEDGHPGFTTEQLGAALASAGRMHMTGMSLTGALALAAFEMANPDHYLGGATEAEGNRDEKWEDATS